MPSTQKISNTLPYRRRDSPSDQPSNAIIYLYVGLLTISVGICYSNSLNGPFILDDQGAIVQNESIRDLRNIVTVLTKATHASVIGRPLLNLSLAVNYWFSHTDNVWDYHLTNIAIHILAAVILFGVVRRTLMLPSAPASLRSQAAALAFTISLIWAVHPLQTESVTYLIQRAESLVAVFYFLSLYCVIRSTTDDRTAAWSSGAITACFLGMSTKEVMFTAPLMIFFFDRVFLSTSFAEIRRKRWRLYAGLAATWFWLAVLMSSSQGRSGSAGFGLGLNSWDYAMTQFGFIVRYLRLTFWPHPLVFDYGEFVARNASEIWPFAAIVIGLVIASFVALRYDLRIGFLGIAFFVILAPTSSIVPLVTQTAAEHRMYLPLAPLVVLIVLLVQRLIELIAGRLSKTDLSALKMSRSIQRCVLVLVVLILGLLTYRRNSDYRTELRLWELTARDFPSNARAFAAMGDAYFKRGQVSRAIAEFSRSIELREGIFPVYFNRGNAYAISGQFEAALVDFTRASKVVPNGSNDQAQSYFFMGKCLDSLGRFDEALKYFELAAEMRPDFQEAKVMRDKARHAFER